MSVIKNNQKGSSLLEALAVLTIISMLATSVIKVISNAYGVLKQSMVISEIRDLQKSISGVYNYSGTYKSLFEDDYYKILCETDKSIPNQMCIKDGATYKLVNRLSGNVILTPSADFTSYSIKVDGLSRKNCLEVVETSWVDRKKVDIYQLNINDVAVAYYPQRGGKSFPILSTTAISSCSKSGKNNTVELFFY